MAAVTLGEPRAIACRTKARLKANIRRQESWPRASAVGLSALAFLLSTCHLDAAGKPPKQSAADSQKVSVTKDQCAPEPGDAAPPLPAKILDGQGQVHFPITTASAEAQQYFDQGVAQMHSFWAREAERSFLQAAELDPSAPMPWWGVAMVAAGDWRPRFQIDTLDAFFGKQVSPATSRARAAATKAVELSQA